MKYSKNFQFFLKEQIGVVTSNNGKYAKFFSRLDGTLFKTVDGLKTITDEQINDICLDIHKQLNYYD